MIDSSRAALLKSQIRRLIALIAKKERELGRPLRAPVVRERKKIWRENYRVKGRAYSRFIFTHPITGDRVKRSSMAVAKKAQAELKQRMRDGAKRFQGAQLEDITHHDRTAYELGIPPRQLTDEGAESIRRKRGGGLAADTVAGLVSEFLAVRGEGGVGAKHLADLTLRLKSAKGSLVNTLGALAAADLTEGRINDWLRGLPGGQRSRLNYRRAVSNFVRWAKRRVAVDPDGIISPKVKQGVIEIFTPVEMDWLLSGAGERLLRLLLLGGFAGLRTSEALALQWADINWASGTLTVRAGKTGRRIVPLALNLRAWLEPVRGEGSVVGLSDTALSKAIVRGVESANRLLAGRARDDGWRVAWKRNALRHSYVSYRCAVVENEAKVALETGHSVAMLRKNYHQRVDGASAAAWFAIYPMAAANVVPFRRRRSLQTELWPLSGILSAPQPRPNAQGRA